VSYSNKFIAPAQNTIKTACATCAPNSLPERLIKRALPDHQANPVDSDHDYHTKTSIKERFHVMVSIFVKIVRKAIQIIIL
jgi:hypothetical protein